MTYPHQPPAGHGYTGPQQPGPYPPAPQLAPQAKRRRRWPWIVGGILVLLVLAAMCSAPKTTSSTSPTAAGGATAPAAPASSGSTATVTYEILGSGKASTVSYSSDGAGSISQDTGAALPWRKEITVDRGFAIVNVTAQNARTGELTCRITVDGQVVKEAKSSGQYAVVSCTSDPIT